MQISISNLKATSHAMSNEETRYYLCGVYVIPQGMRHTLVATTGHTLVKIVSAQADSAEDGQPIIIPSATVKSILDAAKQVKKECKSLPVYVDLDVAGCVATVTNGVEKRIIPFKAIDGTYPDYERVIPNMDAPAGVTVIGFNADLMHTMGKSVKDFLDTDIPALKLTMNDASGPALIGPSTNNAGDTMTGVIMPMRV